MAAVVTSLDPTDVERALSLLLEVFGQQEHPEDVAVELATVDPARFYGATTTARWSAAPARSTSTWRYRARACRWPA
ncbi:MAG: hypothetical protein JWN08_675 [Frankiales bacterium]|nr:hypothetical protein [Frankiales bacterium]